MPSTVNMAAWYLDKDTELVDFRVIGSTVDFLTSISWSHATVGSLLLPGEPAKRGGNRRPLRSKPGQETQRAEHGVFTGQL